MPIYTLPSVRACLCVCKQMYSAFDDVQRERVGKLQLISSTKRDLLIPSLTSHHASLCLSVHLSRLEGMSVRRVFLSGGSVNNSARGPTSNMY